jgi:hypothetical protein
MKRKTTLPSSENRERDADVQAQELTDLEATHSGKTVTMVLCRSVESTWNVHLNRSAP